MQMIAAIVSGTQPSRMRWIARGRGEIHYSVEGVAVSDPRVDGLANLFTLWTTIPGSFVGSQRAAYHFQTMCMSLLDDLMITTNEIVRGHRIDPASAYVINPKQQHHPP